MVLKMRGVTSRRQWSLLIYLFLVPKKLLAKITFDIVATFTSFCMCCEYTDRVKSGSTLYILESPKNCWEIKVTFTMLNSDYFAKI